MTFSTACRTTAFFLAVLGGGMSAEAIELRLRPVVQPTSRILKLGDVCDIAGLSNADRDQWNAVELGLAPQPGTIRHLSKREIREVLDFHRVPTGSYELTGPSSVQIGSRTGSNPVGLPGTMRRVSYSRSAGSVHIVGRSTIERTIVDYLEQIEPQVQWKVALQTESMPRLPRGWSVTGGRAPWTGRQQFELIGPDTRPLATVVAEVSLPPAVVVAIRSLPRGAIVRPGDVELQQLGRRNGTQAIHDIREVIGRETTRSLTAGTQLSSRSIQMPVLVRRRQKVDIVARARGITVTTSGIAKEDGAHGDFIEIETQKGNTRSRGVTARVVSRGIVEVVAMGTSLPADPQPLEPLARQSQRIPQLSQQQPASRAPSLHPSSLRR